MMATIGRHNAVVEFPNGKRLSGIPGWLAWLGLHIVASHGLPQPSQRAGQLDVELRHI